MLVRRVQGAGAGPQVHEGVTATQPWEWVLVHKGGEHRGVGVDRMVVIERRDVDRGVDVDRLSVDVDRRIDVEEVILRGVDRIVDQGAWPTVPQVDEGGRGSGRGQGEGHRGRRRGRGQGVTRVVNSCGDRT